MSQTIKIIQRKLGLLDDGIVGKNTARAIVESLKINTIAGAHLLGQCYHETGGFQKFRENLNYSAQGLAETWPQRYAIDPKAITKTPNELALTIERDPVRIANITYADRNGNRDEESDDGWKYRGVGAIHLTGLRNIQRFAVHIGRLELVQDPNPIETVYAFEAAHFFFYDNNLFKECTDISSATVTRIGKGVNRGNVDSKHPPIHNDRRFIATREMYNLLTS